MASVHKSPKTKFWQCSFYDATSGKWRQRSTRTAKKTEAEAICLRFESHSRSIHKHAATVPVDESGELVEAGLKLIQTAAKGELGEDTAREFVNKVRQATGEEAIEGHTIAEFLDNWVSGKKLAKSEHTAQRYRTTVKLFKESLGEKNKRSLSAVTARDVEKFRDARLRIVGASTVADDLKILRTALNAARRQGLVHTNVVEAVDFPKSESRERDAFTAEEVSALVQATDDREWKTAILFGFYAGLRLGDAVSLEWKNVDLENSILRYKATKTKKLEEIPLNRTLLRHLKGLKGPREGSICPSLRSQKIPGRSGLSRKFLDIVRAAGIDTNAQGPVDGKGRSFTAKSFHSLRHGFVSALANAGVAPELRQKLSGHATADTHRKYTHMETKVLRDAVDKI